MQASKDEQQVQPKPKLYSRYCGQAKARSNCVVRIVDVKRTTCELPAKRDTMNHVKSKHPVIVAELYKTGTLCMQISINYERDDHSTHCHCMLIGT